MGMKQEEFVSFILEDKFTERTEMSRALEEQLLLVPTFSKKEKSRTWMAAASIALLIGVNAFALNYNSKKIKKSTLQEAYSTEMTNTYSYEE